MNAKIKWIEDQKMLGESGTGHSVVMDALDSGKGVSPMEMLLLGVGGCTSLDVLSILKKSRQDVVDLEVQVEAEREQTHPRIFHEVRVHYVIKGRKISFKPEDDKLYYAKQLVLRAHLKDDHENEKRL